MTTIDDYLADLERLLADVDPATRESLIGGIHEELAGLSPAEAEERLRALGDPAFVAASVRAEAPAVVLTPAAAPVAAVPPVVRDQDAAWYSVVTVLLITVGGFVLPVVGWIAGVVMLWASKTWTTVQKSVGTLVALAAPGFVAAALLPWRVEVSQPGQEPPSPVGPTIVVVVYLVVWFGGAIWLLVVADRARRR